MLGADGTLPLPRTSGEWLALVSGILWSIATTGIRTTAAPAPAEAAFVFALGGAAGALALAPLLAPWPAALGAAAVGPTLALAAVTGGLWWGLSMVSLMWATTRLEPARVGILLMAEVLVGALSAAVLAGEPLGRRELVGGVLVLSAGVLELWPSRVAVQRRPG
jgi:drug/metabolite transporter (DMT)-like permease